MTEEKNTEEKSKKKMGGRERVNMGERERKEEIGREKKGRNEMKEGNTDVNLERRKKMR